MCGAPQRRFARLIAPMRLRSSVEILGLPTGLRDRSRQYDWNPARCQRMIVSGRRIAIARRTEGNQRQSQTNRKRSVLLSCGRFDTCRRSTLSCWRRTRISATSFVLGLKNEAMIWRISRRNSIIKWQRYRVSASRLAESNFRYRQGAFEFRDDGSRSLFETVAVMTGLSPLVRELEARLAADVE